MGKAIGILLALTVLAYGLYVFSNRSETVELRPSAGVVDLSAALPGKWNRVCVVAPYSTNSHAREILGVAVNIELRSSIAVLDNIALLVTLHDGEASGLYEVPRGGVDFAHLGGKCYRRRDARFSVPEEGHPLATPMKKVSGTVSGRFSGRNVRRGRVSS